MSNKLHDTGERTTYSEGSAHREPAKGKGRPDLISPFALLRLAKHYENGSEKYGERNWENGMPYSRYMAAILRHALAYMMNDRSEDHLSAIAWNAFSIMHHEELGETKWDDLPKYNKGGK